MIEIYKKELKELKERMEKAEKFANKIPIFKNIIIERKLTGEEGYIDFGSRYKDIYLAWGIKRCNYASGTNRTITNYDNDDYNVYVFSIYFNSLDLFGDGIYNNFGLEKIKDKVKVFFYDGINSTYYVEDEHIEKFLEEVNKWYLEAKKQVTKYRNEQEIKKLKEKLAELENKGE
ncbi:MAG TPA: hypothetical protein IAC14_08940 [Candidatus Scybalomonas excrementigallinarum]|nr:hypothetical protein [Candidatus Scybalomonas excrementigallinarum]